MWPVGWSEGELTPVVGITTPGVTSMIRTCSVAAKSGVGMEGLATTRKKPGPKIQTNNKKPQAIIRPAAR